MTCQSRAFFEIICSDGLEMSRRFLTALHHVFFFSGFITELMTFTLQQWRVWLTGRAATEKQDQSALAGPAFLCRDNEGDLRILTPGSKDASKAAWNEASSISSTQVWYRFTFMLQSLRYCRVSGVKADAHNLLFNCDLQTPLFQTVGQIVSVNVFLYFSFCFCFLRI